LWDAQCIMFLVTGNTEMAERGDPPKFECYALSEDKPAAKPNPFKVGEAVRLRDGKATNGTVSGILGNQVLIAWDNVPGNPQWYHQDFVAMERRRLEDDRVSVPEEKPAAKPNPFKIGEAVRLREGTATNGTVRGIMGNQVLVAWDNVSGDPQWYHQDFVAMERRPVGDDRVSVPEEKPAVKPNPFKIGDSARLRDGTATNGIVTGILVDNVLIAWDNVSGDPQWYHQDFVSLEQKSPDSARASDEIQAKQDIVDDACRLVARMDDNQRRRFITYIREIYE